MENLSSRDTAKLIGILDYHVDLPKVGNGIRAVITLRELISKELPKVTGLTLDMICAYGVRCKASLNTVLAYQIAQDGDSADYSSVVKRTTEDLISKYGKEGERWERN